MANTDISEAMRAIARKRWAGTTPEQRKRNTDAANAANRTRPRKKAADLVADLEARFTAEVDSLRAEVADLRQRVAA